MVPFGLAGGDTAHDPHDLRPRHHHSTPSSPLHGLATFSCPTEIPIEQWLTQVTRQLLRRLLTSSGPGVPSPAQAIPPRWHLGSMPAAFDSCERLGVTLLVYDS